MFEYKVKIALAPMRRNLSKRPSGMPFAWDAAEKRAEEFVGYIEKNFASENVEFVNSKGLGCNDLMFDDASMREFLERFKSEDVDAVMIINCNFGNEEIAADLARELGKPVLLWAPLDEEYGPDGVRTTDSQCGLFGVSRQFQRFHIPFSHLPSCRVDSPEFSEGFNRFVRVACMVKNFKGMRIGQIGGRPMPFFSVIWNEGELMEKFGIKIIPINFALIEQRMKTAPELYTEEISEYEKYFLSKFTLDEQTPKYVRPMATLAAVYKHLFEEYNLDILSAECWTATPVMFDGLAPCAVYGMLNDMGYIVACESDIHCAMTMALLKCATLGEGRPLFGEFTVRHPENKNAELLWHCGLFPLSQKAEDGKDSAPRIINQREWFRAKDGVYTVARIDQDGGEYSVLPLLCKTTDGPATSGTYLWAEFDDLQNVEDRIIDGPYIHHFVEIEGDYRKEIAEFCKYFSNLKVDKSV
ncbi:MAG: hypothetical protein IKA74_06015 [Clostridia bacterium]|nr:hypothetical protein [Clostridia bacterium]